MSSQCHSFSVAAAKAVGVRRAVILQNFSYWHLINAQDPDRVKDGHIWLFSSIKGFGKVWEYMTEKEIRTDLEYLEESGYLRTGNYNKFGADRTKWYALTDLACTLLDVEFMPAPDQLPKRENVFARRANDSPNGQNGLPAWEFQNCPPGQIRTAPEGEPIPLETYINTIPSSLTAMTSVTQTGFTNQPAGPVGPPKRDAASERLINEIQAIRQQYCGSRWTMEDQCKALKIQPDYWHVLATGFFNQRLADVDAGEPIKTKDLRRYAAHWIRTQAELGTRSGHHPQYAVPPPPPGTGQPRFQPPGPSAQLTSRIDYGDYEIQ